MAKKQNEEKKADRHESIKQLKPEVKMYKVWIGDGLYVAVTPSGAKSFRFKYRFAGKEKTLTFGLFPDVTLSQARELTVDARRLLAQGVDPSEAKKTAQNAIKSVAQVEVVTFKQVALEVVAQKRLRCTEGYTNNYLRSMELHVFPEIGDKAIADLKSGDVLSAVQKIKRTYQPFKLTQRISEVFDHAVLTQRREYNPVNRAINKSLPPHREISHRAIAADDLPDFYADLVGYRGYPLTRYMIEFLMHSFMRTGELRRLEPSHINFKTRQIEVPGGLDIGHKNTPIIPLTDAMERLILKALEITGEDRKYVFPKFNDFEKMSSENVITQALRNMGWKEFMTGHGFRALATSTLEEVGRFSADACQLQLGHVVARNDTEGAYRRIQLWDDRVKMMAWWGKFLDGKKAEALARL